MCQENFEFSKLKQELSVVLQYLQVLCELRFFPRFRKHFQMLLTCTTGNLHRLVSKICILYSVYSTVNMQCKFQWVKKMNWTNSPWINFASIAYKPSIYARQSASFNTACGHLCSESYLHFVMHMYDMFPTADSGINWKILSSEKKKIYILYWNPYALCMDLKRMWHWQCIYESALLPIVIP